MKHGFFWATAGVTAALFLAAPNQAALAADLSVGDPAPAISVESFVKGTPVTTLGKGKVSVVEFWATWCGPCIQSIPHVTELAKKYPTAQFVGVSVWESDQKLVVPFVSKMGSKMNYSVAMDRVPPGAKGSDGAMAKTWMTAAGQTGIPTAFIVGKDGKIAWIGHPMLMAEPLAKITAGTWNVAAESIRFKKEQAVNERLLTLQKELAQPSDPKATVAMLNREFAAAPTLEFYLAAAKLTALMDSGETEKAVAYGSRLIDSVYKNSPGSLNQLAWGIVDPAAKTKAAPEMARIGLQAAQRADALSLQKDAAIADTLAAAYFASGDTANALKTEERAAALSPGDLEIKASLERYRKALAETGK